MPISSRTVKIVAVILVAVIVVAVAYTVTTFPRVILSASVAFSSGPDQTYKEFDVPALNDKAQVEVTLPANSTSWKATIENVEGVKLWETSGPRQENQTIYHSAWTAIASGRYNFTFSSIGPDALNAEVRLTSKGGFW